MALTVFETTEQLQPCHAVEQGGGDGGNKVPAAEKAAVMLKETDHGGDGGERPERDDIWNMIQAQKPAPAAAARQQAKAPYVHPQVRRSSSLLTQKSLEICTESLGSETGSDGFSDADRSSCPGSDDDDDEGGAVAADAAARAPAPPSRAFPPPLPSLARRTVGAVQMRQHRSDGRLVVQAIPVPSPTLFRAQRKGGRLLLSFADTAAPPAADELDDKNRGQVEPEQENDDEEEEEEEEEEVEVVDRGTVVEVKVSTQPQARSGGTRVHRSALVINKFVGAEPAAAATCGEMINDAAPKSPIRRCTGSTTTAIAALAAASALSAAAAPQPGNGEEDDDDEEDVPGATIGEHKLLMTAKRRRSKEELMTHMRRCGQLSGKLFFWEPRIATSS